MAESNVDPMRKPRQVRLSDGAPATIRPIRADGGPKLIQALENLSPEGRYQRFLHNKHSFSSNELDYLTCCDGINHLALVLVITDAHGHEREPVAVARCVRDENDTSLAEVAITVADAWQNRGIGKHLFQSLAEEAKAVGITRWQALLLNSNTAAFKLLQSVGTKQSQHSEAIGTTTVTYLLNHKGIPTQRKD